MSGTDREDALLTPGKAQCSERGSFITSTSSIFLTLFRQMAPPWFLFHLCRGPTYICTATGGLGQSTWRGLAGSGSSIKPSATSPTPSTSTSNHPPPRHVPHSTPPPTHHLFFLNPQFPGRTETEATGIQSLSSLTQVTGTARRAQCLVGLHTTGARTPRAFPQA